MALDKSVAKTGHQADYGKIRNRGLTCQQVAAIRLSAEIGEEIRKNHPEIAEEYRCGSDLATMIIL
jgi:hypothetical protein